MKTYNRKAPRNDVSDLPPSDAERIKGESRFLRGTIKQDLQNPITAGFTSDNSQLLRPQGMYQQDDRDLRAERKQQKLEPLINIMLRCRIPGGLMTSQQWLAIDKFASEKTLYKTIRLTNRQTFQLHGVAKRDLPELHQLLQQIGLDARGTAGDVNRNVLSSCCPQHVKLNQQVQHWADKISEHLLPKTHAYDENWLNAPEQTKENEEPLLGKTYLPRKFKTAIAIPPLNDVDINSNDLNFIAIEEQGQLQGFNVLIGGGLSITHGDETTHPGLAKELGFIQAEAALMVAEAVLTTQRDWGNRSNRRQARLRYTLERVGLDEFRKEVENRADIRFEPIKPYRFSQRVEQAGWQKGDDDNWYLTLFIESGRFFDDEHKTLKKGMAEIAQLHQGEFWLTANQNLIVAKVAETEKAEIDKIARRNGLLEDGVSRLRQNAMSCVSFPTCPLAMAEAERMLPEFVDQVEEIMQRYGLSEENLVLRVTGCGNGCGRALLAEVGLIGKAPGRYNLYLGGDHAGNRIPRLYQENITLPEILQTIESLLADWSGQRLPKEDFGDFLIRTQRIKAVTNPAVDFYHVELAS